MAQNRPQPVSYTHLDVYKRQGLAGSLHGGGSFRIPGFQTVSYTHLIIAMNIQPKITPVLDPGFVQMCIRDSLNSLMYKSLL